MGTAGDGRYNYHPLSHLSPQKTIETFQGVAEKIIALLNQQLTLADHTLGIAIATPDPQLNSSELARRSPLRAMRNMRHWRRR